MLATLIANIMRKKGSPPAQVGEFMPGDRDEGDEEEPWDTLTRILVREDGEHKHPDSLTGSGNG